MIGEEKICDRKNDYMPTIYVDADACPVKEEVYKVAIRNEIEVIVVSNGGIRPHQHPLISIQVVSDGLDVADNWILDNIKLKDLVITNDIPLAAECIRNGANIIKPDGKKLDTSNIGSVLATRNLMNEYRSANLFLKGKGKKFSDLDRSNFLNTLESEIRKIK